MYIYIYNKKMYTYTSLYDMFIYTSIIPVFLDEVCVPNPHPDSPPFRLVGTFRQQGAKELST